MFENEKCSVGLKADGGFVIPHDPDGETQSVPCHLPVVAMEKYGPFDFQALSVCETHRHLVHKIFEDLWAD